MTTWLLSRDRAAAGVAVVKTRVSAGAALAAESQVHPGWEWFTLLTGRASLELGDRVLVVEAGEAAEFSTMVPHRIGAVPERRWARCSGCSPSVRWSGDSSADRSGCSR